MAQDTNYIKQIELVQSGEHTLIDIGIPHLISISYNDLKELKSNGKLVPGVWYRITDYSCSVKANDGGSVQLTTGGHNFDIIVLAVSESKFSEECRAISNDTSRDYFKKSDLLKWKVWYSFDGDDSKYNWVNTSTGYKGVIYRLIDDYGNDCPYDFKNIRMNGRYTFDDKGSDATVEIDNGGSGVKCNVIKPYRSGNIQYLNNIIINGQDIQYNTFDDNCHDIKIGNDNATCDSQYNVFGKSCHDIKLGNYTSNNVFGNNCHDIYIGSKSSDNHFGNDCQYVLFGNNNNAKITNTSTPQDSCNGIWLDDTVSFISLYHTSLSPLNFIHVHKGVHGGGTRTVNTKGGFTYSNTDVLALAINKTGQNYEINISKEFDTSELVMWYI